MAHTRSAPEEGGLIRRQELTADYLSVHIRVAGDWTTVRYQCVHSVLIFEAFATALGCDFDSKAPKDKDQKGDSEAVVKQAPLNRTLPRVMIDG
jgi:hypothetical protein